jgi:hypothetical protein
VDLLGHNHRVAATSNSGVQAGNLAATANSARRIRGVHRGRDTAVGILARSGEAS